MPFAEPPTLNLEKDDALACVDVMSPLLQQIIDRGYSADALICALTIAQAELLQDRGGRTLPLRSAMKSFATFPKQLQRETRECLADVREMNQNVHASGYTTDAITWSMIGAITNIYGKLGMPKAAIDECRNGMIMHLNDARKTSLN